VVAARQLHLRGTLVLLAFCRKLGRISEVAAVVVMGVAVALVSRGTTTLGGSVNPFVAKTRQNYEDVRAANSEAGLPNWDDLTEEQRERQYAIQRQMTKWWDDL
jgi:hypothetical protein